MNALRIKPNADRMAATSVEPSLWLNVLVELTQPQSEQLANLDRSQRYTLLAARTRQQRAELEMWLDAEEFDDQVLSIGEMEAMGMLLIQCTPTVAAHLAEAPGVAGVAVTGHNINTNEPMTRQIADA
jgi:hypothetical protein